MPKNYRVNLDHYQAAREGAACYRLQEARYLLVAGADRLVFLQRQTTNDLRPLEPATAIVTALTSPTARILDVLTVFCEQNDTRKDLEEQAVVILTTPGIALDTYQFLKSRIFFMDKVSLTNLSNRYVQIDLLGARAKDVVSELGVGQIPEVNTLTSISLNEEHDPLRVLNLSGVVSPGYRLVVPVKEAGVLADKLKKLGVYEIDDLVYECVRIEAGLPAARHEISQEFTPLEVGLRGIVSDSKGCYTGQEVIARQLTYDKASHSLCGIRLKDYVAEGAKLLNQEKEIGSITSLTESPIFGLIGLAIIKRPFNQPGMNVQAGSVRGEIVSLPFIL